MRHLVIKKQTSMFLQKLSAGSSTYFFLVDNNASAPFAYGDHTRSQIIRVVFVHLWSCLTVSFCVVFFNNRVAVTEIRTNEHEPNPQRLFFVLFVPCSVVFALYLISRSSIPPSPTSRKIVDRLFAYHQCVSASWKPEATMTSIRRAR